MSPVLLCSDQPKAQCERSVGSEHLQEQFSRLLLGKFSVRMIPQCFSDAELRFPCVFLCQSESASSLVSCRFVLFQSTN